MMPARQGKTSVVISFGRLARFARSRRPRGGLNSTPAPFKQEEFVSRQMPDSRSIRRSDHPRRPKAMTRCFFSSLRTLLTRTEDSVLAYPSISWMVGYSWPLFKWP